MSNTTITSETPTVAAKPPTNDMTLEQWITAYSGTDVNDQLCDTAIAVAFWADDEDDARLAYWRGLGSPAGWISRNQGDYSVTLGRVRFWLPPETPVVDALLGILWLVRHGGEGDDYAYLVWRNMGIDTPNCSCRDCFRPLRLLGYEYKSEGWAYERCLFPVEDPFDDDMIRADMAAVESGEAEEENERMLELEHGVKETER